MAVITNPTPGAHFSNGVTAGDTQTLANGNTTANGSAIGYNARWQWNLTGAESSANAGSNLQLQAIADDGFTVVATAISVNRATGAVTITGGGATEYFADGTVSAPSIANTTNHGSGIYFTTNAVNITANGVRAIQLATATTGVNYLVVTPSAAGTGVSLSAAGSDTDINLNIVGKGAGVVSLGATSAAAGSFHATTVASSVNFINATGAIASSTPSLTFTGTDSNVGGLIIGKGTGSIYLGGASTTVYGLQVATVASQAEGLVITGAASGANAAITAQTNNVALCGTSAIATNATTGMVMIPTTTGTPTGVPVGHAAGATAMVYDTGAHKIWFYDNGTSTWRGVAVT